MIYKKYEKQYVEEYGIIIQLICSINSYKAISYDLNKSFAAKLPNAQIQEKYDIWFNKPIFK
jgi:hypothetical protein